MNHPKVAPTECAKQAKAKKKKKKKGKKKQEATALESSSKLLTHSAKRVRGGGWQPTAIPPPLAWSYFTFAVAALSDIKIILIVH